MFAAHQRGGRPRQPVPPEVRGGAEHPPPRCQGRGNKSIDGCEVVVSNLPMQAIGISMPEWLAQLITQPMTLLQDDITPASIKAEISVGEKPNSIRISVECSPT